MKIDRRHFLTTATSLSLVASHNQLRGSDIVRHKRSLRVAGAQIPVVRDIEENVTALNRAINYASDNGADILLTPEGSLSGYTHEFDISAAYSALTEITLNAKNRKLGLALGTCMIEKEDGHCYNQIRFYNQDGDYLGFHSKTLTCGTMTDPPIGEINHYKVSPLRTFVFSGITIAGLICNDMWANPICTPQPDTHLSQRLSKMGVNIIFHSVNGGRNGDEWSKVNWQFHESNLRIRARAGRIWVVTVDNCHPQTMPCSCPSGVMDPQGNWVCRAQETGEQFFVHTIDI